MALEKHAEALRSGSTDAKTTIANATSDPSVYHFGELLDLPEVQQVQQLLRMSVSILNVRPTAGGRGG